jgi:hypothetical protein
MQNVLQVPIHMDDGTPGIPQKRNRLIDIKLVSRTANVRNNGHAKHSMNGWAHDRSGGLAA